MNLMDWTKEHNERLDALEAMIDKIGLNAVVETLAEVCSAKADHIRTNWQDEPLAKGWDRRAARLINVAVKL